MKKRVLLTGLGGMIGSNVMEHILTKTDWHIVGIASWRHKGLPERITDSLHYQANRDRVDLITHDLVSPINELTRQRIGNIDYIINVASESHVDRSIIDPVTFTLNNTNLILNMLEYARIAKPRLFMQISTDEVYGVAPVGTLHKEWSSTIPSNPYAGSKAAQEAIAVSYWRTYGVPVIITNCFDPSVRVFSEKGFSGFKDIEIGDRVWAMNERGEMILTPVLEKVEMPNEFGKLVEIKTQKTNQLVTPNHRIYVHEVFGKGKYTPIKVLEARELLGTPKRVRIPTNGKWVGEDSQLSIETIALAGWYVSEGYSLPSNGIAFGAASRGQQEAIINLCSEYGKATINARSVRIHSPELKSILSEENFGKYAGNKRIPAFIKGLRPELLRYFFDAAIDGDGSRYPMAMVYYTKSNQLAIDMCEIGMKLGYAVRISKRKTWNPKKTLKSESFIVRFRLPYAHVQKQNVRQIESTAKVWCIKTAVGNVFVERDGIISLSGQTMNNFSERQDKEKYIPMVINRVLKGETITIHSYPDKKTPGSRFYLHARNHADALIFLVNHFDGKPVGFNDGLDKPHRFNVVGEREVDNLTLAHMIADVLERELKYELVDFHSSRPGHDCRYGLDGSKLKELGWVPPMPFEKSLRTTVLWTVAHPEWLL